VHFRHASEIWNDYPELVPGVLAVEGISKSAAVGERLDRLYATARSRLAASSEGELPEIQAWRRVFSRMGLKPTQYRCAAESLLRRFRKDNSLPLIHPLIDLCNAVSLAFAIPIAVFDVAKLGQFVEVRYATGSEVYATFSGERENPEPREVIFADGAGRAHARRWSNRQSGDSAVRDETRSVLLVAEAMHASARTNVERLTAVLTEELRISWSVAARTAILSSASPQFDF